MATTAHRGQHAGQITRWAQDGGNETALPDLAAAQRGPTKSIMSMLG